MNPGTPVRYTGKIVEYQNRPLTFHSQDRGKGNCLFPDKGRPRGIQSGIPPDFGVTTWLPLNDLKPIEETNAKN